MRNFILASASLLSLVGSSLGCSVVNGVKFTAYGFPDASGIPAYKCNGAREVATTSSDRTLLGDGSPQKPYAAAASRGSIFRRCELVYIPLLEKYFRVQDDCSGCVSSQLDLYIAQYNSDVGQSSCELAFGTFNYGNALHEVMRAPPTNYALQKLPLFTASPKKCWNNANDTPKRIYPERDGTVNCPNARGETTAISDSPDNKVDQNPSPLDSDPAARHKGDQTAPPKIKGRTFEA